MRIAVISDARRPTLPDGPHGLGRSAHDIATGLAARGHDVTLFAGKGSRFDGALVAGLSERDLARTALSMDFDAIMDTSHQHHVSRIDGLFPVLNRMADRECYWQPPNAVVNSRYMQGLFPTARHAPTGVDVEAIPFFAEHEGYLVYMSGNHKHKGIDQARAVAAQAERPLYTATSLTGREKWERLGKALALLHPSTIDAAPRLPLEAAACGVPTLCLDGDGAQEHVAHGVSGFVCSSPDEMARIVAVCQISALDRRRVREWVADTHGMARMIDGYEELLESVEDGERW